MIRDLFEADRQDVQLAAGSFFFASGFAAFFGTKMVNIC